MELAFHEMLVAIRRRQGLSQEALAAQVGVQKPAISRYESGGRIPPLSMLLKLEKALGVEPGSLIRASGHAEVALSVAQALKGKPKHAAK